MKQQRWQLHWKKKGLGRGDHFGSSSHTLLLTEHAANGLVEALLKLKRE